MCVLAEAMCAALEVRCSKEPDVMITVHMTAMLQLNSTSKVMGKCAYL